MPILNVRIQAEMRDDAGNHLPAPPDMALGQVGPRVQITLAQLKEQIDAISGKGEEVPAPVVGYALIDTGASATCVDSDAAGRAGLPVVDSGPLHSVTHANETVPIYAGSLTIQGANINLLAHRAYGVNLVEQGLIALIGRDVLSQCILVYNGPDSSFSISI
ncbi:MAG: aspartyl protease family protein [Gammaproteobacteria bacterium]|nr:aspartyl protease family protein [Gammaproteobacteria bacterium]